MATIAIITNARREQQHQIPKMVFYPQQLDRRRTRYYHVPREGPAITPVWYRWEGGVTDWHSASTRLLVLQDEEVHAPTQSHDRESSASRSREGDTAAEQGVLQQGGRASDRARDYASIAARYLRESEASEAQQDAAGDVHEGHGRLGRSVSVVAPSDREESQHLWTSRGAFDHSLGAWDMDLRSPGDWQDTFRGGEGDLPVLEAAEQMVGWLPRRRGGPPRRHGLALPRPPSEAVDGQVRVYRGGQGREGGPAASQILRHVQQVAERLVAGRQDDAGSDSETCGCEAFFN